MKEAIQYGAVDIDGISKLALSVPDIAPLPI
jgi:hypothetical protein